ncbi:hypothetical protein GCM10008174_16900 [Methylopila turkensis]|uniref:Uncharacterized protein n=2 Tax=Methylopila turkensis TaxID=1437816 RepID=A0A9W6JPI1_9HYPH|nr:hypothetical protein GCM10008174_16900 [Methylopila turkensis]
MVSFLLQADSAAEFRKRGFDEDGLIDGSRAASRMSWSAFSYQSRVRNAEEIAGALVVHLGDFLTCTAWVCRRALGDHTGENVVRPDWSRYVAWRTAHGATRTLGEAPGHLFGRGESADLREFIAVALYLGWDTLLKTDKTRTIVKLSHDDRIELYHFSAPAELKSELGRLCEPAPWFDPRPRRR